MKTKEKAGIKQSIIPELVSGSSTQTVVQQQALKILKKFQGLSNFITACGFSHGAYRLGVSPTGAASKLWNTCHKAGDLSGSHPTYKLTYKEEALNKGSFRATLRSGFTLIELLVVVLIIGILAAVALPQYQKAVEKSRAVEAIVVLKNLRDQQSLCFLEKGKVADCGAGGDETKLTEWGQGVPDSMEADDDCWFATCEGASRDFSYALDGPLGLRIYAVRRPFATKYALITTAYDEDSVKIYNKIACYNWDEDKNWCQMLGLPEVDSLGLD